LKHKQGHIKSATTKVFPDFIQKIANVFRKHAQAQLM